MTKLRILAADCSMLSISRFSLVVRSVLRSASPMKKASHATETAHEAGRRRC